MVQSHGRPHSPPFNFPAPACFQQAHAEPAPIPRHRIRPLHGYILAIHTQVSECTQHIESACGTLLPSCCVWDGDIVLG